MNSRASQRWARTVLVTYFAALLALTLLPNSGTDRSADVVVHLDPFGTIGLALRRGLSSREGLFLIGNLLAFVPLGVLVPLALRRRSVLLVIVAALGLSTAIELAQFLISTAGGFNYRTADIDDVIVNVAGAVLGYLALIGGQAALRDPVSSESDDAS